MPLVKSLGLEVVDHVGAGAWADVWHVRRRETGESLAWKQLRREAAAHPAARQLLANEAEVGQVVRSPRVIRVVEAHLEQCCLLLEWHAGRSLEELLVEGKPFSVSRALWVARQCAEGLAHLAAAGFVHGDLKPQNVLVDELGAVKLVDLGFARRLHAAPGQKTSCLTGTPEYLAPEALANSDSGTARDLYSLGVILFRMLSGRLPFGGESLVEVLHQQRQSRPPALKPGRPEIPVEVVRFVERLLAKQPIRRPSSPQRAVEELVRLEIGQLPWAVAG